MADVVAGGPSVSVIIPAHDEAESIERCLRAVFDDPNADSFDVIVVCNGCSDATAERSRSFDPRVTVIDLPTGSKPGALNAGDEVARAFPRVYLDADVVVSRGAISAVVDRLAEGDVHAAAPRLVPDVAGADVVAAAYYRVWFENPYFHRNLIGAGFYALSEEGRGRFERFPDIMSDDMFVHELFTPGERATVNEATFTPLLPLRYADVLKVESRHAVARLEYGDWRKTSAATEVSPAHHEPVATSYLRELANDRSNWPDLAAFGVAKTLGHWAWGSVRYRRGDRSWNADRASRSALESSN